jgi:hypothetical protein
MYVSPYSPWPSGVFLSAGALVIASRASVRDHVMDQGSPERAWMAAPLSAGDGGSDQVGSGCQVGVAFDAAFCAEQRDFVVRRYSIGRDGSVEVRAQISCAVVPRSRPSPIVQMYLLDWCDAPDGDIGQSRAAERLCGAVRD